MMKKYQLPHPGGMRHFGRHLDSAVTKALFGMLVLVNSVLRIVYQHIGSLHKCNERWIALFPPFDIGGKNQYPTRVLNTIDHRAIQWMTVRKPGSGTHLRFARILNSRTDDRRSPI